MGLEFENCHSAQRGEIEWSRISDFLSVNVRHERVLCAYKGITIDSINLLL